MNAQADTTVWCAIEARCVHEGGAFVRRAWKCAAFPLLAVTVVDSVAGEDVGQSSASVYGVTHLPSGYALAKWFQRREAAEELVLAIGKLADWTLSPEALAADPVLQERFLRIRADIYRREAMGAFGPFDQVLAEDWNTCGSRESEVDGTPARPTTPRLTV